MKTKKVKSMTEQEYMKADAVENALYNLRQYVYLVIGGLAAIKDIADSDLVGCDTEGYQYQYDPADISCRVDTLIDISAKLLTTFNDKRKFVVSQLMKDYEAKQEEEQLT